MQTLMVQGKLVVRRNGAFYAVRKMQPERVDSMGRKFVGQCDAIHAAQGGGDGGWDRQMIKPGIKVRGTRSIKG